MVLYRAILLIMQKQNQAYFTQQKRPMQCFVLGNTAIQTVIRTDHRGYVFEYEAVCICAYAFCMLSGINTTQNHMLGITSARPFIVVGT